MLNINVQFFVLFNGLDISINAGLGSRNGKSEGYAGLRSIVHVHKGFDVRVLESYDPDGEGGGLYAFALF